MLYCLFAKGVLKYRSQVENQLKNSDDVVKNIDELIEESKKVVDDLNKLGKSGSGGFLKYKKVLSRNMVRLEELMSCAAACVRQLAKDININLSEAAIRKIINTDFNGTDALDLYKGLKEIFKDKEIFGEVWFKKGVSDLDSFKSNSHKINGSFITNVGLGNNKHAIIVDKIQGNNVYIRDPWPIKGIDESKLRFDADDYIVPSSVKWVENKGVEAIVDFNEFIEEWSKGGSLIIKIN